MATKKKKTAIQKQEAIVAKDQATVKNAKAKVATAKAKVSTYKKKAYGSNNSADKAKYESLESAWGKVVKTSSSALSRDNKKLATAESKLKKTKVAKEKANLKAAAAKIKSHAKEHINEGNAGIYRSDGGSSEVIFVAPTGGETDNTSTDITTWPVDEGAPRSNYARVSDKSTTITGIITGGTTSSAKTKFNKLLSWNASHKELTFKGKVYYKHLMFSEIDRTYDDFSTNIKVVLTFKFAYAAKITTKSTSKTSKKKTSKSAKTTQGTRNKTYTTITIKAGDTLWGYAQKYNVTVAWLQKVNGIKGTTIYAGKKIRVK